MFLPIGDDIESRSLPILPGILICMNLLVFAYQIRIVNDADTPRKMERQVREFYDTWGLTPSKLEEGEVVGLLSHMFVHGGLMHLAGNMIVLWAFACSLEVGIGGLTLFGFYILWGLIAGMTHAFLSWGSELPLVGASGAIAGLIGAYTVLYGYDAKIKALFWLGFQPIRVRIPAIVFGLCWIGMQLLDASNDPEGFSGVAWYAHIGGFFAGFGTSWLFLRNDLEKELVRDSSGVLCFQDKDKAKSKVARLTESAPEPVVESTPAPTAEGESVDACPYCHSALEQATEISPGLLRCGNEGCQRLVYAQLA